MNRRMGASIAALAIVAVVVLAISYGLQPPKLRVAPDSATNQASDAVQSTPGIKNSSVNALDNGLYEEGALISESGDFVVKQVHARNCRMLTRKVIRDDGETFENVQHCDEIESFDHPYGELTEEQLRPLAETDGAAAFILAERLDKRLPPGSEIVDRLYVHALALSDEEQAFVALYDHMTGGAGIVMTETGLDVDHIAASYIWASVGERLGYNTGDEAAKYRSALLDVGLDISQWNSEATKMALYIGERRQAATGETFE